MKKNILAFAFVLGGLAACQTPLAQSDIGASLHDKVAVELTAIPVDVIAVAKEARPDLEFKEASRINRNNTVYYDIEGEDATGAEIELDIVQAGDSWKVVEVQRDIRMTSVPAMVAAELEKNVPGVAPDRIIESLQTGDQSYVYEFFTQDADGKEAKYEVSYAEGIASFLTEEAEH